MERSSSKVISAKIAVKESSEILEPNNFVSDFRVCSCIFHSVPDLSRGYEIIVRTEDGDEYTIKPTLASDHAARVNPNSMDEFVTWVMRKPSRIKDTETLLFAAKNAIDSFNDVKSRAVALAVLGYRKVEAPDATQEQLNWLVDHAGKLRAQIDWDQPEDTRWAPSIDIMMYQVCALNGSDELAVDYLVSVFKLRPMVSQSPVCAFNISIGILVLGYLYYKAERYREAYHIWRANEALFVAAVNHLPKKIGTMKELGVVYKNCFYCVCGMTMARAEGRVKRDLNERGVVLTDPIVSLVALRVKNENSRLAIQDFFSRIGSKKNTLPDLKSVLLRHSKLPKSLVP